LSLHYSIFIAQYLIITLTAVFTWIIVALFGLLYINRFSIVLCFSMHNNFTFFIPIFSDYFLIYSLFFFKGAINSSELFISINQCYSILLTQFITMFFSLQLVGFLLIPYSLNLKNTIYTTIPYITTPTTC